MPKRKAKVLDSQVAATATAVLPTTVDTNAVVSTNLGAKVNKKKTKTAKTAKPVRRTPVVRLSATLESTRSLVVTSASQPKALVRYYNAVNTKWVFGTFQWKSLGEGVLLADEKGTPLLRVHSGMLTKETCDTWLSQLRDIKTHDWLRHMSTRMVNVQQPRYITSWTVDAKDKEPYVYSKTFTVPTVDAKQSVPITNLLAALKAAGADVDYVLGNLYEPAGTTTPLLTTRQRNDLDDSIDEHADNEPIIDQSKSIWSVSLGDTRRFTIRVHTSLAPNTTTTGRILMTIDMPHGLVIEMCPGMQQLCTHAVHKRSSEERKLYPPTRGLRINATARKHKVQ